MYKYEYFLISAKFKINQSEKNTRRLCKIIDDLKIVKHDYSNILQTLNGYVITKQYDDLEKHIKRLINESKQINFTELINPNVFNQPAVYGIIDSKYFDALEKNIKVNVDVATNIREINFDFIDLSRVLGILLDNAIEASEKTQSKEMSIEFTYNPKKEADIIEIKNSINPNANIDINKIFNKGASSKKKKSGLGLWEVKNIISSTSNSKIYTNINDTTFSQTIVIEKS
ncbi:MAG: sensor histidine kinase [Clostridia bacterium]